jgi:hypothetical protein
MPLRGAERAPRYAGAALVTPCSLPAGARYLSFKRLILIPKSDKSDRALTCS